jgi:hypothetical protein
VFCPLIADQFPFFRTGGSRPGNGLQLGVAGAVFAQFDLATPSYDLLNMDYLIAVPLTFRAGPFSGRARVYHQSSHLGDELLLRQNPPARENLSFESAELLLSLDLSALRVYAGGEDFVHRDSSDLPTRLGHVGIELRPRASLNAGALAAARFVAAADGKIVSDSATRTGLGVRAGFEFSRPHDELAPSRRWSLLAEYYDGPSPLRAIFSARSAFDRYRLPFHAVRASAPTLTPLLYHCYTGRRANSGGVDACW